MDTSRIFRSLVLGGASLALSACGPGGSGSDAGNSDADMQSPGDAGNPADAGNSVDAGPGCTCTPDPTWPGNDCGPTGTTAICCWNHATQTCCPG
jgi:hypothetical protein